LDGWLDFSGLMPAASFTCCFNTWLNKVDWSGRKKRAAELLKRIGAAAVGGLPLLGPGRDLADDVLKLGAVELAGQALEALIESQGKLPRSDFFMAEPTLINNARQRRLDHTLL
jgi:hypothetical protein